MKENYLSSALCVFMNCFAGRYGIKPLLLPVPLLCISVYLAAVLGTSFMPDMDAPQMAVSIEMPKGKT